MEQSRMPKKNWLRKGSLTHALLILTSLGGLTLLAVMAPNVFQVFGQRRRRNDWWQEREAKRFHIRQALKRLRERRLITYEEKGKETFIKITLNGNEIVKKFEFNDMKMPRPAKWDGKWRLVIFDIPESRSKERQAFREKLQNLGFAQLQKSVWAYPYDCRDEIDFLTHFLEIPAYVLCVESNNLGSKEGVMRMKFGLL